jgi:hypothetical protein
MYISVSVSGYIACVVVYSVCVNMCMYENMYACTNTAVSIHILM